MELEDYLDFCGPTDVRLRGTTVGLEQILWDYLRRAMDALEIYLCYRDRGVTCAQVYGTLTLYWRDPAWSNGYLAAVEAQRGITLQQADTPHAQAVYRLREMAWQREQSLRSGL